MGKKTKATSASEQLKDSGNKAFAERQFDAAVDFYTQAIEKSTDKPNHVYFSNRANAYLELNKNQECIKDC
tara:strand:+ start:125 stop:337 length:213 start_codon:yes stop_codon:yes gene_type:complete